MDAGVLTWAVLLAGCTATLEARAFDSVPSPHSAEVALLWQPAPGAGRRPVVLALHGCGGLRGSRGALDARYVDYAARWNAAGWHVLLADSFSARGVRSICREPGPERSVTLAMRRKDVNAALAWLQSRNDVDPDRIALVGWSNGGSTVLRTIDRPQWTLAPAAAIAFYPGCAAALKNDRYAPAVPLLVLIGALDDWTPARPCEDLERRLNARTAGPRVELVTYADSYHGFDGTGAVRRLNDIPRGAEGYGVHVGGNPAARADALARTDRFLKKYLD